MFGSDELKDGWERTLCLRNNLIDKDNRPCPTSTNRRLPIYNQKEEIVDAIRKNPVVIIVGSTGCGKTTQV